MPSANGHHKPRRRNFVLASGALRLGGTASGVPASGSLSETQCRSRVDVVSDQACGESGRRWSGSSLGAAMEAEIIGSAYRPRLNERSVAERIRQSLLIHPA